MKKIVTKIAFVMAMMATTLTFVACGSNNTSTGDEFDESVEDENIENESIDRRQEAVNALNEFNELNSRWDDLNEEERKLLEVFYSEDQAQIAVILSPMRNILDEKMRLARRMEELDPELDGSLISTVIEEKEQMKVMFQKFGLQF